MQLKKLLRFVIGVCALASICTAQPTTTQTTQQSEASAEKLKFIPVQVTLNPRLNFTKEKIQDLRRNWGWDNGSIKYQDSIPAAEPYPDSVPVMYVYFNKQIPDNTTIINIVTYYAPRGQYSNEQLIQMGTNIASLTPQTPGFYIDQTTLNDAQPTEIWIQAVLDNGQKVYCQPIYLPSLQTLGISTLNNWIDTPTTQSKKPGNDIY